jgi:hypothetical protein
MVAKPKSLTNMIPNILISQITDLLLYIVNTRIIFINKYLSGGPHFVGRSRLLMQLIRSYLPYLEAFASIRNLRTRHAVVTMDPPNMEPNERRQMLPNCAMQRGPH